MSKQQIKQLVENRACEDGMVETGVKGVQLFRVTCHISDHEDHGMMGQFTVM